MKHRLKCQWDYRCIYAVIDDDFSVYIGSSKDFKRRMREHKSKQVNGTMNFKSHNFVVLEQPLVSYYCAMSLERFWISKLIENDFRVTNSCSDVEYSLNLNMKYAEYYDARKDWNINELCNYKKFKNENGFFVWSR